MFVKLPGAVRREGRNARLAVGVDVDVQPVARARVSQALGPLDHGRAVGRVTSAAWAATTGSSVGLATVWHPDGSPVALSDLSGDGWHVDVGGRELPVSVSAKAPYDPANGRIRS